MALTFGKINRAASFNPQTAFPLDARSYFESYALALEAAQKAEAAGSTNTVYYFGQVLTVVENNIAKQYQIQPDNTLLEVGTGSISNEQIVEIQESIENLTTSIEGVQNSLGDKADASVVTEALNQKANSADVEEALANKANSSDIDSLEDLIAEKADASALADYAKISDVYTKDGTEQFVASAIANADHLKRQIVDNIDMFEVAPEEAEKNVIYMVKTAESGDMYKEYMRFDSVDGTVSFEQIGDTSVDMSAYAKTSEVDAKLLDYAKSSDLSVYAKIADIESQYATKEELNNNNNSLADIVNGINTTITTLQDAVNANKESIEANQEAIEANQKAISSKADSSTVESLQGIVTGNSEKIATLENKELEIRALLNNKASTSDLNDAKNAIQDQLDNKVSKEEGSRLINAEEIEKLGKLSFSDSGELGFSGTVDAGSVLGLTTFIGNELTSRNIENGAQANKIEAIYNADGNAFEIKNKSITIPYASDSIPGLIKVGQEFSLDSNNALTVDKINVNKLIQTEELLLDCGGAASNRYASQV